MRGAKTCRRNVSTVSIRRHFKAAIDEHSCHFERANSDPCHPSAGAISPRCQTHLTHEMTAHQEEVAFSFLPLTALARWELDVGKSPCKFLRLRHTKLPGSFCPSVLRPLAQRRSSTEVPEAFRRLLLLEADAPCSSALC